ncbi:MAG: DEAD/DEAH box helicase family protein [Saccharospirillaceae bacterium]|nr:SNF2-related protein [Pseudomonadales bacterium]NRB80375.1 DEAD/DEAH box helicase family protein [Saccharospirillaceae bacterium]
MKTIDNINDLLGEDLKLSLTPDSKLKIAASCFSIYAYVALKEQFKKLDSFEFIFTEPTFSTDKQITDKIKKEHREFHIPSANREKDFFGSEFEIHLKNKLTQKAIAKECAQWIKEKATFKSNITKSPMQQFAINQKTDVNQAYVPLHGFTAVDLGYQQGDAISNIMMKFEEPSMTQTYLNLFDQLWQDKDKLEDVTANLIEHITEVYQENSPERVYFLIIYNIFHEYLDDLNEDVLPNDKTGYQDTLIWNKLFNYQRDGATGIINKLETYNGCILADSVGLGKTFTALAVMKYYELRNKSVLLLCPKKLADNWLTFNRNLKTNIFSGDRFNYDVLCHTDISRTSGESFGTALNQINWGNYDLVVIDESHNFRNNIAVKDRETRYQQLMNKVIKAGVKTKVLMLSATPVNNRFTDLKNQLALAYEGDSEILSKKLKTKKSVEKIFLNAQRVFNEWSKLDPENRTAKAILDALDFDFFELLDSVTIARSRKHIQNFYDTTDIGKFPIRRKPLSFHCGLTTRDDVLSLDESFVELSKLTLSIYAPVSYILPSRLKKYEDLYDTDVGGGRSRLKQTDREKSLVSLMTTNLLKRLESSVEAFRLTLNKLQNNHQIILNAIEAFFAQENAQCNEEFSSIDVELESFDDDYQQSQDMEIGNKIKIKLMDMDLPSWKHALLQDMAVLTELLASMNKIKPEDDLKLQHLKQQVFNKINNPINPGNKKILLFTAFTDTANYLYKHLAPDIWQEFSLHSAMVSGGKDLPNSTLKTNRKGYNVQEILTLFSPRSKDKAIILPDEPHEIDLLIGTDCISEGQNLQDCDYVINYDIHWNPVRIIQRFGRVDRIGSPNESIQLVNYWPDISLDEYINLKERVESRMTIVDVTATGDDNVLSAQANDVSYRKEQLKRLQEEVIELEDLKTGISITDLGLNEFRMDLVNYIKQYGEPNNTPNGMHAVVPAKAEVGLHPGVIFVLKNINTAINIDQQNRLHPYYVVYVGNDGNVVTEHTQVKSLLDLLRSSCKGQSKPIDAVCQLFNQNTKDGKKMDQYSELLNQAIRSMIHTKQERDVESLFSSTQTSALVNHIKGLDDFELIAFIVVQGEH